MWNVAAHHAVLQDAAWSSNSADHLDFAESACKAQLSPLKMDHKSAKPDNSHAESILNRI